MVVGRDNPQRYMKKEHKEETIKFYSHDYREMAMSENELKGMLEGFVESLECEHECSSDCRRNGCNCNCGEWHF